MTLIDLAYPYQKKFIEARSRKKIWCSSRQVGKSWTLAFLSSKKAISKKNALILAISVTFKASQEFLRKVSQFAQAIEVLSKGTITSDITKEAITFSNGSRVISLASGNPEGLRGYTADLVIVDEAGFIENQDDVFQAITPTLTRNPDSELILCSTPSSVDSVFYKIWSSDDDTWYRQSTTIYQAKEDGLNVDIDALRSMCLDNDIFDVEYCCQFSKSSGSMIDTDILEWFDDVPASANHRHVGVDIGSTGDRTAFAIISSDSNKCYVEDIVILQKSSYQDQMQVLKELNDKHHFISGLIDATGIGSAFSEFANRQVSARIKGFTWSSSNKTPSYEIFRSMIFDRKIAFSSKFKDLILSDIRNVRRVVSDAGKVSYVAGHNENGHSDVTSALVLATQSIHDNPVNLENPVPYTPRSRLSTFKRL